MERPRCRRCGGPLDFFHDPEDGVVRWFCNNPGSIISDAEFQVMVMNLSGDEVAQLERALSCS